jgi:signal recognition particle receptor subunit beta
MGEELQEKMTLETKDDRTLFFDLLPLTFDAGAGLSVRIKLFTVPGQVMHNATRRLVLQGADGVAFIADSQVQETEANRQAFLNLRDNLTENAIDPMSLPIVIQFNKRDLPGVRTDTEIASVARASREPVFPAIATRGIGVVETFVGLLHLTWRRLEETHDLRAKFGIDGDDLMRQVRAGLRAPEGGVG